MKILDRYRGCLLAGGVGDQLGNDVEFMRREEMLEMYGERGVRIMSQFITDDTQMTLFTAEGMLMGRKHHMPMPACVYQSYLDWYATQMNALKGGVFNKESVLFREERLHRRRAPGNTCLTALGSGDMGTMDEPINHSKGCGGVMRTAPCGLLKMIDTPDGEDAYAIQGAMAAAITHTHIMGYVPAAMLSDMVHMILLEDGRTLKEITLDSLARMMRLFSPEIVPAEGCEADDAPASGAFVSMLQFRELMSRAVKLAETDVPVDEAIMSLGEGWVGDEALAIAVYCVLKYQDDMEACLSAAVTHDGDSDSTGAIAGNILGAWLGVEGIPAQWLAELEMRGIIDDMACRLFEAAQVR
ncbi:MAG: ADP-ribosylglycohydrolase family protein [Clostridia bacterium]|nr:ADP-ribosylglycohydrolase family protein [Clostridia bacterium]